VIVLPKDFGISGKTYFFPLYLKKGENTTYSKKK